MNGKYFPVEWRDPWTPVNVCLFADLARDLCTALHCCITSALSKLLGLEPRRRKCLMLRAQSGARFIMSVVGF